MAEAAADRAFWDEIAAAHRAGGRDFYASIHAPFELYALARLTRPAHVLEAGVSSGVSSAAFLRALQRNGSGTLHSIDYPTPQQHEHFDPEKDSPVAVPPGRTSGWAVPKEVRGSWDLRIGKTREVLPGLVAELPRIEIFLHDDEHTHANATFEFTTVRSKMAPGGILLADNTDWLDRALEEFGASLGSKPVYRTGTDLGGVRFPD